MKRKDENKQGQRIKEARQQLKQLAVRLESNLVPFCALAGRLASLGVMDGIQKLVSWFKQPDFVKRADQTFCALAEEGTRKLEPQFTDEPGKSAGGMSAALNARPAAPQKDSGKEASAAGTKSAKADSGVVPLKDKRTAVSRKSRSAVKFGRGRSKHSRWDDVCCCMAAPMFSMVPQDSDSDFRDMDEEEPDLVFEEQGHFESWWETLKSADKQDAAFDFEDDEPKSPLAEEIIRAQEFQCFFKYSEFPLSSKTRAKVHQWIEAAEYCVIDEDAVAVLEDYLEQNPLAEEDQLGIVAAPMSEAALGMMEQLAFPHRGEVLQAQWTKNCAYGFCKLPEEDLLIYCTSQTEDRSTYEIKHVGDIPADVLFVRQGVFPLTRNPENPCEWIADYTLVRFMDLDRLRRQDLSIELGDGSHVVLPAIPVSVGAGNGAQTATARRKARPRKFADFHQQTHQTFSQLSLAAAVETSEPKNCRFQWDLPEADVRVLSNAQRDALHLAIGSSRKVAEIRFLGKTWAVENQCVRIPSEQMRQLMDESPELEVRFVDSQEFLRLVYRGSRKRSER